MNVALFLVYSSLVSNCATFFVNACIIHGKILHLHPSHLWYRRIFPRKGLSSPLLWIVLHTDKVSETTFEETVGNFPLFN